MIVTVTEMGKKVYTATFQRNGRRRVVRLTREMRDALVNRGRRLWATAEFGKRVGSGKLGQQAQYEVV